MEWKNFRKRKFPTAILPFPFYFYEWNIENVDFDMNRYVHIADKDWTQDLIEEGEFNRIAEILTNKIKEDKNYLAKKKEESREIAYQLLEFCKKFILDETLKTVSEEELIDLLKVFFRYYTLFSNQNIPLWVFAGDKINDELKLKINQEELQIISTPVEPSYSSRFELNLLKIAKKIRDKNIELKNYAYFLSELEKDKMLLNEFSSLKDKYFWIPFDYLGPDIYDAEKLFSMIKELEEVDKKILEMQNRPFELKIKQEEIFKKYDEEVKFLAESLQTLGVMQDNKKEYTVQAHFYLNKLLREIANRLNLELLDVYRLLPAEIETLLLSKRILSERKEKSVSIFTPREKEQIKVISGKNADKFMQENGLKWIAEEEIIQTKKLTGTPASRGYARARAKILHSPREINKIGKGEILVSTMTTPDFVPAMEKASAIITDEGGVTCHAAIVSRELNIPCVVGTKIATRVIKDGDYLEVDANKGVINILTEQEFYANSPTR